MTKFWLKGCSEGMFLQCPWFSLKSFLDFWNRNRWSYYKKLFFALESQNMFANIIPGGSWKWTLIMDSRCSHIASMAGTGPPPFSMSVSWRNRFPRVWGDPPWEESRILIQLVYIYRICIHIACSFLFIRISKYDYSYVYFCRFRSISFQLSQRLPNLLWPAR